MLESFPWKTLIVCILLFIAIAFVRSIGNEERKKEALKRKKMFERQQAREQAIREELE